LKKLVYEPAGREIGGREREKESLSGLGGLS